MDQTFDPTSTGLRATSQVKYSCGRASEFNPYGNGTTEPDVELNCGVDGNWAEDTTLPPCQCELEEKSIFAKA